MKYLISLISDSDETVSSKRVMAMALIISGIVGCFITMEFQKCSLMIASGISLLVASAITKS
jgi:hypothetical protein